MLEELKELEQEAIDNLDPDTYESIVSNVLSQEDQEVYQSGYIDGLQTAIRLLSEDDSSMSYTVEIEDIYDDVNEEDH